MSQDSHREIITTFIRTYKDLPVLWDTNLKQYFDRNKKTEAYEQLVQIYKGIKTDATREDVKKKINSLRSNYNKELRRIRVSALKGDSTYEPRSWTFQELTFLNDILHHNDSSNAICEQVIKMENFHEDEERDVLSPISSNDEFIPTSKRQKVQYHTTQNDCGSALPTNQEVEVVTKNWAFKLERLRSDQRIWAEKFINEILTEAELGTLHRHSVIINHEFKVDAPNFNTLTNPTSTS